MPLHSFSHVMKREVACCVFRAFCVITFQFLVHRRHRRGGEQFFKGFGSFDLTQCDRKLHQLKMFKMLNFGSQSNRVYHLLNVRKSVSFFDSWHLLFSETTTDIRTS